MNPSDRFMNSVKTGDFVNVTERERQKAAASAPKPTASSSVTAWGIRTPNVKSTTPAATTTNQTATTTPSWITDDQAFILARPVSTPKTSNKPVDTTSSAILWATDAQIEATKQKELLDAKARDEKALQDDYNKSLLSASDNMTKFRSVLGINADGTINKDNPNSIGASIQKDFEDYKSKREQQSTEYESTRKAQVTGNIRARLAASGIDISKIPPEKLIALSDEVGVAAFGDIYNDKKNALDTINSKQEALTTKLNDLKQKGLVADQEYNTLKTTIDSTFNKTKNEIQKQYVNDIFGVVEKAKTAKEAKQTTAVNTIENFLSKVPSTIASAFRSRYQNLVTAWISPADIYKTVANDPEFSKYATQLAKSLQEAAAAKATAENAKLQSEVTKNLAAAKKASAPASSKPKAPKTLTYAQSLNAIASWTVAWRAIDPNAVWLTPAMADAEIAKWNIIPK